MPAPAGPTPAPTGWPPPAEIQLRAQWSQPDEAPGPLHAPAPAPPPQWLLLSQRRYCLGFSRIPGHGIKSRVWRDVYEWGLRAQGCSNTGLDHGQKRSRFLKATSKWNHWRFNMHWPGTKSYRQTGNEKWNPSPSKVKGSFATDLCAARVSPKIFILSKIPSRSHCFRPLFWKDFTSYWFPKGERNNFSLMRIFSDKKCSR